MNIWKFIEMSEEAKDVDEIVGINLVCSNHTHETHREKNKNNFERRDENGKELILYLW